MRLMSRGNNVQVGGYVRYIVEDQPVDPVTKLWEQRFEGGLWFLDGF